MSAKFLSSANIVFYFHWGSNGIVNPDYWEVSFDQFWELKFQYNLVYNLNIFFFMLAFESVIFALVCAIKLAVSGLYREALD